MAVRYGAVVAPDDRHVHLEPTPTAGGFAMLLGALVAVAVASLLDDFNLVLAARTEVLGVIVAATIIFAVGLIDDLREISPPAKLAGMVLAGSVLSMTGVSILVFRVPFFDLLFLSADWSALVTVLWVVGMANAVNLIDGLDGLAAGIIAIGAGTFLLYALRLGDEGVLDPANPGALWAVIALGVCIGFSAPQCAPGPDIHGRRWRPPARFVDGGVDHERRRSLDRGVQRPDLLLLRPDLHPPGHPGCAGARHRIRHRAPGRSSQGVVGARQGTPAPPSDATRSWPPAIRPGSSGAGPRCCRRSSCTRPTRARANAIVPIGIAALALGLFTLLHPRLRGAVSEVEEARPGAPRPVSVRNPRVK